MNTEIRWKQRFENFSNAYATSCRIVQIYGADKNSEVNQMALTQSYGFTLELACSTLRDYLEHEGCHEVKNAKQAIEKASKIEILASSEIWIEALEMRNKRNNIYDKAVLQELVDFIYTKFYSIVSELFNFLKKAL
jgi:nucleotidyltransferase substrate binding protein (TIGR01987 family)